MATLQRLLRKGGFMIKVVCKIKKAVTTILDDPKKESVTKEIKGQKKGGEKANDK